MREKKLDLRNIIRPEVEDIQPYVPGKPIRQVKEEYGLERVIKLASNENPLPVPESVRETIKRESNRVNRYPDGGSSVLRGKLAARHDLEEDMLTVGNGSDGLLKLIGEAFLTKNSQVVISHPSFVEYNFVARLMGCHIVRVCTQNYRHNMQGIIEAVSGATRIVFLANPDNPTGSMIEKTELEKLLNRLPDNTIVVLDEAYHEYVNSADYPDGIKYVKEGYPVIVLRTFSKAYGLAGLRVGYAVSSPEIREVLMKVRDPFNVNRIAEMAAATVLDDDQFLRAAVESNNREKQYLQEELEKLGLDFVSGHTNFMLINVEEDSVKLFKKLLKKGIIIRPGRPLGFREHIRVTIGLHEENKAFVEALSEILS